MKAIILSFLAIFVLVASGQDESTQSPVNLGKGRAAKQGRFFGGLFQNLPFVGSMFGGNQRQPDPQQAQLQQWKQMQQLQQMQQMQQMQQQLGPEQYPAPGGYPPHQPGLQPQGPGWM